MATSETLEGCKVKAKCLSVNSLELLFALPYCNLWHKSYITKIFNFESDKVARCLDGL